MPVRSAPSQLFQQRGDDAAGDHGDDHVRQLGHVAPRQQPGGERGHADQRDPQVRVAQMLGGVEQRLVEGGAARHREAEKVLELAGRDEERGAGREAHDHGVRDEVDERSQPGQSHRELHQPGHQAERQHHGDVAFAARLGQRRERGQHQHRDRRRRPRHQVPARAPQRRHHRRHHRRVQAVLRRQAGDGGEGHRLRQHDHRPGEGRRGVAAQALAPDQRPPVQQRQRSAQQPGGFHCVLALGSSSPRPSAPSRS
jgi:hypothetical protein